MTANFKYTYSDLPQEFYSEQPVYKYPNAKVLIFNDDLAKSLNLDCSKFDEKELLGFLLGYQSEKPISQAYAGHQFGHFTMLGDGRAILIGEYEKLDGNLVDFHLKGAGMTEYSRGGDGKATLAAMLREYIVGEAMHNLNIPTSRVLAVIKTGEDVYRESIEQGAIAVRVASSHIRVGTFEYAAMLGEDFSKSLLDYTIRRHNIVFSEDNPKNKALALLEYIMDKQSSLITQWQRVGFIHGVMNTDNMTISGETIDYGPCAFVDNYSNNIVFSSIDSYSRYAFENQANIAGWNITKLAESLLPLISQNIDKAVDLAQETIEKYPKIYNNKWQKMILNKFGLNDSYSNDKTLIAELFELMDKYSLDYTNTFYNLSSQNFGELKKLESWLDKWNHIIKDSNPSAMMNANPVLIPRNHQVEKAIRSAQRGSMSDLHSLMKVLKTPYEFQQNHQRYMLEPNEDERVKATFCGT